MYLSEKLSAITYIEHGFNVAMQDSLPANLLHLHQQHSNTVVEVGSNDESGKIAADAVFTRSSRPISIITADCLPILVSSTAEPFVAAIHAGWKGLSTGIIKKLVQRFFSCWG
ncbi:MAG: laccase domain-containing protein [Pseudomonas gingeri]